jgi:ATP-dependent DNA helicase RecQ
VGLDRVSTWGALSDRPRGFAIELLGALEAAGLVACAGGDYPTLSITAAGREVMHDRARARLLWPEQVAPRRAAPVEPSDDGPVDTRLLDRLRALRRRLATEAQLPAYCIFHDRTLEAMARSRPHDERSLADVPGVGPTKLARYGAAFLAALAPDGAPPPVAQPMAEDRPIE